MIAVDTNLLVHAHRREASLHQAAYREIANLAQSSNPWAICYHSLVEFYAVVTQSRIWKSASTPTQAFAQMHAWQESPTLRILTDVETSLEQLESLAKAGKVQGPMIHDARIAACCLSHGVRELWTVDRDFNRFPDLKVRNPLV